MNRTALWMLKKPRVSRHRMRTMVSLVFVSVFLLRGFSLAQSIEPTITVNGKPVFSQRPVAKIDGEWFVPLAAVARAMNAQLKIPPQLDSFRVQKNDGVEVVYEARTGELRQGAIIVGRVSPYQKVLITASVDELFFPLQGIVALFGAEVREDRELNTLRIDTSADNFNVAVGQGATFDLANLEYNYGYTTNVIDSSQFTMLRGEAVSGTTHLTGNLLLNKYAGHGFFELTQGTLRAGFVSGKAVTIGDQTGYTGIDAFSQVVRGVGYETHVAEYEMQVYGGRAVGSLIAVVGLSQPKFDTNYLGFNLRRKFANEEFNFGANWFNGAQRSGSALGVGYTKLSTKNRFNVQGVIGNFSGFSSRTVVLPQNGIGLAGVVLVQPQLSGLHVSGFGTGFSISDVFTPIQRLSISGQIERYSESFLTARDDSRFSGQKNFALSTTYRFNKHLEVNASVNNRSYLVGDSTPSRSFSFGGNFSTPTRLPLNFGYFRSIQQNPNSSLPTLDLSQYSFSLPRWKRYSAFTWYYRTSVGGVLSETFSASLLADYGRFGQFGFHHQRQFGSNSVSGASWQHELRNLKSGLQLGLDRSTATATQTTYSPYAGGHIDLPFHQSFEFRYADDRGSKLIQFSIGGPLIARRELVRNARYEAPAVVIPSHIYGTVYEDVNQNGSYDPGTDIAVSGLSVVLDDGTVTTTNANGAYRFAQLTPGSHKVRADLSRIPADMVLVEGDERTVAVIPRRENITNFRLLKAGRIKGRVSLPPAEGATEEQAAPEIRIFARDEHDAITEVNGSFFIGDLAPGSYQVQVDLSTVPAGFVATPKVITVMVKPGETSPEISFRLVVPHAPVIERQLPAQQAEDLQQQSAPATEIKKTTQNNHGITGAEE
ncbi:MAG: hypothetical protein JWO13_1442 [Acidobacteriales bacterium]|nr:hypothetical protein [Terriglobales bacterium]